MTIKDDIKTIAAGHSGLSAREIADCARLSKKIREEAVLLHGLLRVEPVPIHAVALALRSSAARSMKKGKSDAVGAYTSSVLGFVPLAATAVYSSTKAAVHSYVLSQRFMLRDTTVRVLEIAPPWVRTELMNSQEAEEAMPLEQFIEETIAVLRTDADEILVDAAKPLRANAGPNEHGLVNGFNAQMTAIFAGGR